MPEIRSLRSMLGRAADYSRPSDEWTKYHSALFDPKSMTQYEYLQKERMLDVKTIRKFRLGVNAKGDIAIPVFKNGELIDYKFRSVAAKNFYRVPNSETWVVNEEAFVTAKEDGFIIITEGEFDAMAVWQMGLRSVVSSTGGAQEVTKAEWIAQIPEGVKIYINYDSDEVGQTAARTLAERIGIERCYNVVLDVKDANDFIRAGGTNETYRSYLRKAKRFDIAGIEQLGGLLERLRANKIERTPTFLERFNAHTKGGIMSRSLVVVSGFTGVGKSTAVLNFLVGHANSGLPVLIITLENDLIYTIQRILEIKYGVELSKFTKELWAEVEEDLKTYPFYVDTTMSTTSMRDIKKMTMQAKQLYGVQIFAYDHLHFVLDGKDSLTKEIAAMTKEFKLLAVEQNIIVYLIAHVRKPEKSTTTIVNIHDLKDSSAIGQLADMVLFMNSFKTGYELTIEKSRTSRSHISIPILFDGDTGKMSDDRSRQARSYDEVLDDAITMMPNLHTVDDPKKEEYEVDLNFETPVDYAPHTEEDNITGTEE